MERKKIVGTPFKTAAGENVGYNLNVNLDQNNKTLPTGEVVRVVSATEQFEKERKDSTKYRLTASIYPTIYYPQEYYWLGNEINSNFEFITGATSTSQTNALATVNYNLPNILTLNGPNPGVDKFEIGNKDNWVVQILYPFENDYLKKYRIPQYNASLSFAADPDNARFTIDTGIEKLVYDKISQYLIDYVNTTTDNWFVSSNFIIKEPTEYLETLFISNQSFEGYSQDGIPFLFSIPVKTEQGWYTALYTPFEHNLEQDDIIFIKPITSVGTNLSPNQQYDTCDPTLYGFKRVLFSKWDSVLNNKNSNYVIIDHKTKYHDDWTTAVAPNSASWNVRSSQGFVKRVKNYSDTGVLEISTENLVNTTFTIVPEGTEVTLTVEHQLKKEDNILLTLSEDATGTLFPNELRPLLYNLSGIYEVTDIVNNFTFVIRSTELTDGIAYFNGNFTFATLPQPTTITVSKMMPYASEYYLRRGKILTTINESEINDLPMSNSIFYDPNANVVIEQDIDVKTLRDNLDRPISELYLSIVKRAGKENYDFTDVESYFSWFFEFSQILVKTGDGLEIESKRCKETDDIVGYVKDVSGGWMDSYAEFLGDSYYLDLTEYNKSTLEEKFVENLTHRFNTSYRECGNGNCDDYLLDVTNNLFGGFSPYASNTSDITMVQNNGADLTSTNAWVGVIEQNSTTGNFVEETFTVPNELVGEQLYFAFDYTQVTSTGIVKILDPGGTQITGTVLFPGNSGQINGLALTGNYSGTFTPAVAGQYKILLGLANFPSSYDDPSGTNITTTSFQGIYQNLRILKYYGTPQYAGWIYEPFQKYQIRRYSQFIETADPQVLGIPDYATFIDGLWYWRDLLDIGYFEDIDFTVGVDYPFLNGKHYVDEEKNLLLSITPNQLGGTNGGGNETVIFGCQDSQAMNFNPFATEPCGADPLQGGPCIVDADGVIQTLVSNPLGCCCFYEGDPITVEDATTFAVRTDGPYAISPNAMQDYGTAHNGYNSCYGRYPYWKNGKYWGGGTWDTSLLILDGGYGLSSASRQINYELLGTSVGVDHPPARFASESGLARYDIFTFQNYTGQAAAFQGNFGVELGDGTGMPVYGTDYGQDQPLSDPDNLVTHPNPSLGSGNNPGGSQGDKWKAKMGSNLLADWPTTEDVVWDGQTWTGTNKYFNHWDSSTGPSGSKVLEFYKFDTSNCDTCYDKGNNVGTGDYFAPRHNWPLLNQTMGQYGPTETFVNENGVTMSTPRFYENMSDGVSAAGGGVNYTPQKKYEQDDPTNAAGQFLQNNNSWNWPYECNWTGAGVIARDEAGGGGFQPNIVAYRHPEDPDNWRFFYGACTPTWGCGIGSGAAAGWGDNSDGAYPGHVTQTSCYTGGNLNNSYGGAGNCEPYSPNYAFGLQDFRWNYCGEQDSDFNNSENEGCSRSCTCLMTNGGIGYVGQSSLYSTDTNGTGPNFPEHWEAEQPSYFAPDIPAGETWEYRFRGRVNIEMGVNHNGFEFYRDDQYDMGGWQFAGNPEFSWSGGPPLSYLNPFWMPNADYTSDWRLSWLGWCNWVAKEMAEPNGYLDYTRNYAGFWIAVVSETDKKTYIYDPDNGSMGFAAQSPALQSAGPGGFANQPWDYGCGGVKVDGVTRAVNKMSYTPCNDHGGINGNPVSNKCGVGTLGGDDSNPSPCGVLNLNGVSHIYDADCGATVWTNTGSAEYGHPRYDKVMADGHYVPSCGEEGSGSNKSSFRKQWSQSFISGNIPLKTGDRVFMFIKAINGAFKTNWKGGTQYKDNIADRTTGDLASAYDDLYTADMKWLPSYLVGQLVNKIT